MNSTQLSQLKNSILHLYPQLSPEEWNHLTVHCQVHTLPAKRFIIEADRHQCNIYFLTSGLVRGFYINTKGEEINIRFINQTGWITHYSALLSDTPSKYTFQTLEKSEYISIPFIAIQSGYQRFRGLERFGRLIAENILQAQQRRIESFQFMNAEQRYLAFIEEHPALFNRVSLSQLSSYLGIQRPSLSRIRKKIAEQR